MFANLLPFRFCMKLKAQKRDFIGDVLQTNDDFLPNILGIETHALLRSNKMSKPKLFWLLLFGC